MSSEGWKKYKFADILSIPLKNGLTKPTKVRGVGYKMVNMGELFANSIIGNIDMARVPMTESEIENFLLESCDLLFARQSLTIEGAGKCSLFKGNAEPTTFEGHLIRARVDKEIAVPSYLYYYFNSIIGINQIKSIVSVTAAAGIRSSELGKLEILLPPLPTQHRITDILSSLDDKIELNRQTNTTLEAIALAIFKDWFVDFNFPGATGEMVESDLGMIPKGWRVGKLGDILDLQIGGDWGQDEPFTDSMPVISLRGTDLDKLKTFGYAPEAPVRWVKKNSYEKRKIENVDILIGGSGLGPIGKSIYCDNHVQDIYTYPITYSNFCKRLRAKSPGHAVFAEVFLETLYLNGEMRQFFTGTSIPNLDIKSLLDVKLVIPETRLTIDYIEIISTEKFTYLFNSENTILSQIRDALLPKLMNGEIDV